MGPGGGEAQVLGRRRPQRRATTTPVRCWRIAFHSFRSSLNFRRKPRVVRAATNFLSPFAIPSYSFVDPVVDPAARRAPAQLPNVMTLPDL